MRHRMAVGLLLVVSLMAGSRKARAEGPCTLVLCGLKCITHDVNMGGFCNLPAPDESGCVQLFGPDCASMITHCCSSTRTAAGF